MGVVSVELLQPHASKEWKSLHMTMLNRRIINSLSTNMTMEQLGKEFICKHYLTCLQGHQQVAFCRVLYPLQIMTNKQSNTRSQGFGQKAS